MILIILQPIFQILDSFDLLIMNVFFLLDSGNRFHFLHNELLVFNMNLHRLDRLLLKIIGLTLIVILDLDHFGIDSLELLDEVNELVTQIHCVNKLINIGRCKLNRIDRLSIKVIHQLGLWSYQEVALSIVFERSVSSCSGFSIRISPQLDVNQHRKGSNQEVNQ